MANIGMRKVFIAERVASKTYNVTGGLASCGHAVSVNITPTWAEGQNYGDDMQVDTDNDFVSASVALSTTNVPASFHETMFGNTVTSSGVTHGKDDEPNMVGYGTIGVEKVDGVRKYVALFMPKCKFFEPADSLETRGDSITYKTPSITGKGFALDSGAWKYSQVCDTEAAAITWLETKFGGGLLGTFSAFSTSGTYAVGDYVTYSNDLYRCVTAVTTAGSWNAENWVKVAEAVAG